MVAWNLSGGMRLSRGWRGVSCYRINLLPNNPNAFPRGPFARLAQSHDLQPPIRLQRNLFLHFPKSFSRIQIQAAGEADLSCRSEINLRRASDIWPLEPYNEGVVSRARCTTIHRIGQPAFSRKQALH